MQSTKHKINWNKKIKEARLTLKHRLFLLERKIECHPLLRQLLPRKKLFIELGSVCMALIAIGVGFVLFYNPGSAEAVWHNDNYAYRQKISFTHNAEITSERRVTITTDTASLITAGRMQSNCADTRFTDINGKALRYQLTGTCNNASTTYNVVFPTINNGDNEAYVYFGNPYARSASQDVSSVTSLTPSGAISLATVEKGPSPMLYWKFDEGYGTQAYDATIASNSGTLTNGPTWQTSDLCLFEGNCLKFDGINDNVQKIYSSDLELNPGTASMSASLWYKHPSGINNNQYLLSRFNAGGYKIYMKPTGVVCFAIDDDSTWNPDDEACDKASTADSEWHHVQAVKGEGSTYIRIYVDGNEVGKDESLSATGSLSGTSPTFYAGIDSNGTGSPWSGFIDEVKIYNYAKTASQVKADFAAKGTSKGASATLGMADAANTLSQGLIGYWKLDETSANTCTGGANDACDSSGNNGDGAWNGNTTNWPGKFGMGGHFDGTGDFISVSDTATLSATTALSISAWASPSASIANKAIVVKDNSYRMTTDTAGKPTCEINNTSSWQTAATSSAALSLASWQHVVCTYDKKEIRIYVNGELKGSASLTPDIRDSANDLRIGSDQGGTHGDFNGNMDDVRVYNRTLSGIEVTKLYDWGTSPVGWWKLDEHANQQAMDSSGNGNNGTLTNNPVWASGKIGGGIQLTSGGGAPGSQSIEISSSSDDAEQQNVGGAVNVTSSDLELAWDIGVTNRDQTIGLRFPGVNIPQGAIITSATIKFHADNSGPGTGTGLDLHFWGEDVDDAAIFTSAASSITSRADTTADVTWSSVPTWAAHDENANTTSPDLSTIVQEIVDRGGWTSGNDMAFFIDSPNDGDSLYRNAESADGEAGSQPILDVTWTTGSSDSYIAVSDSESLSPTSNISISAWVNPTGTFTSRALVVKDSSYRLVTDSSGYPVCQVHNGTSWSTAATSAVALSLNQWRHVGCTYDQNQIKVYVNGIQQGSTSVSAAIANNANGMNIGNDSTGTYSNFIGKIDDVRIYNYARTPKQIVSDMNGGHPSVGSPVGSALIHLKLDDGFGNVASNSGSMGLAIKGALHNFDSPATLASGWSTKGKFDKALTFDGTDDYIDAGTDSTFNFTDTFTFSGWIKRGVASEQGVIVGRGTASTNGWLIGIGTGQGSGCIANQIFVGKPSVYFRCLEQFPADTGWHHLVVTLDGTTTKAYVDGKQTASLPDTTDIVSSSGRNLRFGTGLDGADDFQGWMDELKIYNYPLNANEVKLDYNQGKGVVLGALSTDPDNRTASNSAARAYCPPGDDQGNCAGGALNPAPVGEWRMDENTGNIALDTSGNGNHGSFTSTANRTRQGCKMGTCVRTAINNALENVNVGNPAILNFSASEDFTWNFWINVNSVEAADNVPFHKGANSAATVGYGSEFNSNGTVQCAVADGTNRDVLFSTNSFRDGKTHFVTCVLDRDGSETGTAGLHLFVDGIYQTSDSSLSVGSTTASVTSLTLGEDDSGREINGSVDQATIYKYARTPRQVAWDYNRGQATNWWKFDECSGDRLYSSAKTASGSASGAIGTLSGATVGTCNSGSGARYTGRNGIVNASLDFDGTDDVVQVNNEPYIDLNEGLVNGFTISAWVYANTDGGNDTGRVFTKGTNTWCRTDSEVGGKVDLQCSLDLATTAATINIGHAFTTNTWNHVVLSWNDDSDDEISVWINGRLRGTSNDGSGAPAADANNLFIGGNGAGASNTAAFDGQIDEVMIFPYEMTTALMRTLYNQMSAVRFAPLTGTP